MRRLEAALSGAQNKSVESITEDVVSAVQKFAGAAPQFDDITCLTVRFKKIAEAP